MQGHFTVKWSKIGKTIIRRQDHANNGGAETCAEGYKESPESETHILEESSPADEITTSRGNAPTDA